MEESKKTKPTKITSMRLDDETSAKFKELAKSIGGNQDTVLSRLIESYEFQVSKSLNAENAAEIEKFERYVSAMTRIYFTSLEERSTLSETIRAEFAALLSSKDAIIQDLQSKLTTAEVIAEDSRKRTKAYESEKEQLKSEAEKSAKVYEKELTSLQKMLGDKDNLNQVLTGTCNDLKEKVEDMKGDRGHLTELQSELSVLRTKIEDLERENSKFTDVNLKLKETIEDLKQQEIAIREESEQNQEAALSRLRQELDLQHSREKLSIEQKYQTIVQQLQEDQQEKIDRYQQKYYDLLERLQEQK